MFSLRIAIIIIISQNMLQKQKHTFQPTDVQMVGNIYSLTYSHYTIKRTVSNQDKILILHSGKGGISTPECNAQHMHCRSNMMQG